MGVFTLEEVKQQIANIKKQLLAENQSYSISPSDGGTSRSVTRVDRAQLIKELNYWTQKYNSLTGASKGKTLPTCTATFGGSSGERPQTEREGWEIPR